MDDATGSPSRGTAVPGATYVYQHTQSPRLRAGATRCASASSPTRAPTTRGQKTFKVGETVTWTGGVVGGGAPYHDGEIVDTMPDGIDYTPGSAQVHRRAGGNPRSSRRRRTGT